MGDGLRTENLKKMQTECFFTATAVDNMHKEYLFYGAMKMTSLYERLGGEAAMEAAVGNFYARLLADPNVAPFFDATDMERQKRKQKMFLTMAVGGPPRYDGKTMRHAHEHLLEKGLDDPHVDAVERHLDDTLIELGVPEAERREVIALVDGLRDDVLGRTPAEA